ncbi:MAG: HEPN domain-containing protein [Gammaproteobacteria bacterium]
MGSKAIQSFEHSIKDATELLDHFDALNTHPPPPQIEVLKRASLVMALAALETYFEELLIEYVEYLCSQSCESERLTAFFRSSLKNDLKVFHSPSTDRVKPIFIKYLGVNITEAWSWNNIDPTKARKELNNLVRKRGDIAHRSIRPVPGQPSQHVVTRDAMRKHIHFIKELVRTTDIFVQESVTKSGEIVSEAQDTTNRLFL